MKINKVTKILLFICGITVITMLLFPLVSRYSGRYATDSGFDGGYDSGGWDSGSDWDSGSSWDSGSGSGDAGDFLSVVISMYIIVVITSFIVQFYALATITSKKGSTSDIVAIIVCLFMTIIPLVNVIPLIVGFMILNKYYNTITTTTNTTSTRAIPNKNFNEVLAKYGFSSNVVVQQAYAAYKRIQIAWMNGDVDPVRDVLSDEIYNMYKTQLMTLSAKKQKNMMENITFKSGTVTDVIEQKDDVAIVINMKVTCRDYIINTKNNQVVRGDKNHICNYNYSLTFTFNKNDAKVITNCPGCNAKLPIEGKSIKCEYCGTTIKRESTNLVMTKKTMISQS